MIKYTTIVKMALPPYQILEVEHWKKNGTQCCIEWAEKFGHQYVYWTVTDCVFRFCRPTKKRKSIRDRIKRNRITFKAAKEL